MKLFTPSILPLLMRNVALETMPFILFVMVLVNLVSWEIPTDEYNFDQSSSLVLILDGLPIERMSESSSRALTAFWILSFELSIAVFESALSVRLRPTSSGFLPSLRAASFASALSCLFSLSLASRVLLLARRRNLAPKRRRRSCSTAAASSDLPSEMRLSASFLSLPASCLLRLSTTWSLYHLMMWKVS